MKGFGKSNPNLFKKIAMQILVIVSFTSIEVFIFLLKSSVSININVNFSCNVNVIQGREVKERCRTENAFANFCFHRRMSIFERYCNLVTEWCTDKYGALFGILNEIHRIDTYYQCHMIWWAVIVVDIHHLIVNAGYLSQLWSNVADLVAEVLRGQKSSIKTEITRDLMPFVIDIRPPSVSCLFK